MLVFLRSSPFLITSFLLLNIVYHKNVYKDINEKGNKLFVFFSTKCTIEVSLSVP